MEPITATIASGLLMLAFDRMKSGKAKGSEEPPFIPPTQARQFTFLDSGIQTFHRYISNTATRILRSRSARLEQPTGTLAQVGRVWRIVPLEPGLPLASEVVEQAWKAGEVVMPSLSLVLVPNASEWACLIVTGQQGSEQFAGRGSHFAVLAAPIPETKSEKPAEPVSEAVAEVIPTPQTDRLPSNGSTTIAKPRTVVEAPPVKDE